MLSKSYNSMLFASIQELRPVTQITNDKYQSNPLNGIRRSGDQSIHPLRASDACTLFPRSL